MSQRPLIVIAALTLAAAAVVAQTTEDPRRAQPGDVVEVAATVDDTAAVPIDAGPVAFDAGAAIVVPTGARTAAAAESEAVVDESAAPSVPVTPAPSRDPAEPKVDDTEAHIETSAPRVDPDGERAPEPAAPTAPAADQQPAGLGFGGVPALNYDADNGFGFGVIANLFVYDGETRPYRASVMLQIFMTTKGVQDHHLTADWLKVGGLPLRLWSRLGYLESRSQNYCGLGGYVTCRAAEAEAEAARLGLEGDAADEFARHFYLRRFINPYAQVQARWALVEQPARLEITGGYRGGLFIPGTLWADANDDGVPELKPDLTPYPDSLFERAFPGGQPGFESVAQLGVMLDTRDNEPAPTEGVWLEASARASSPIIGSAWQWAGGNLTLRGYAPLDAEHKVVLCDRLIFDGVLGDPPIQSLVRLGGSNDFYVLGGADLGRGIRAQRYIGKLRLVDTAELRWRFADVDVLGQRLAFTAAGFVDAGLVGREIDEPGPMPLQAGVGGALRVAWNENFIIRLDIGFSSAEGWQAAPYLLIGNPF